MVLSIKFEALLYFFVKIKVILLRIARYIKAKMGQTLGCLIIKIYKNEIGLLGCFLRVIRK